MNITERKRNVYSKKSLNYYILRFCILPSAVASLTGGIVYHLALSLFANLGPNNVATPIIVTLVAFGFNGILFLWGEVGNLLELESMKSNRS